MIEWIFSGIGTWFVGKLTDSAVTLVSSRKKYINTINKEVCLVKSNVFLSINTIDSRETNKDIASLQDSMEVCVKNKLDVKVLVSTNKDSYKGAYELYKKDIPLRFISEDIGQHLNFTVVDYQRSILSIKNTTRSIKKAIIVNDDALNRALKETFTSVWNNEDTLSFPEYIMQKLHESKKFGLTDSKTLSDKFNVPFKFIEQLNVLCPLYVFIIGRPGSGKTEIAKSVVKYCELLRFDKDEVEYIDDYFILREWARGAQYARCFEEMPHDGFKVVDFSIINLCNEEILRRIRKNKCRISPMRNPPALLGDQQSLTYAGIA